jgi:cytochrome c
MIATGVQTTIGVTICAATIALSLASAMAADAEHGKLVFQACAACHGEGPNPLGPSLRGVFGRKSASVEDYRYSAPMMRANLVWDEANLKDFLSGPQGKVKGNRMPFGGVTNTKDLEDLIAYLKILK